MPRLADGLVDTAAQSAQTCDRRIYGPSMGTVINNVDSTGLGRVQVRLSWLPGVQPWARVITMDQGSYFIPQVGSEVLVAFDHGDIREPYIVGCAWNAQDQPPVTGRTDPVTKRVICTPMGHEIRLDEANQSITITNSTQQKVTMDPSKIEITTTGGTAIFTLDREGNIAINAANRLDLKAPSISIHGGAVDIKSDASTRIKGGQVCEVQATLVKIN